MGNKTYTPHHESSSSHHQERKKIIQWAFYLALGLSGFLLLLKGIVWKKTGYLTFQASFMDSAFDGLGSLMNLLIVRHALKPADNEHRFGHGKLEALVSLGQCFFVVGSCLWFFLDVMTSFFTPGALSDNGTLEPSIYWMSNGVMAIGLVLIGLLLLYQRFVWKKTGSLAVKTDYLHYQSDFLMTILVFCTFNLSVMSHYKILDVVVSLALIVYLFYGVYHIGQESLHILMDRELSQKDLDRIQSLVLSHPDVLNFHELRTRSSGHQVFIQLHLDLDPSLTLQRAHDISHEIEDILLKEYPHGDIIIHQDPLDEFCKVKKSLKP